uniref:Uncharacterized protein n=1 Tax=Arundo donax TaxID=35708 RepID=A0A0A8ZKW9_ARUDO
MMPKLNRYFPSSVNKRQF